ncbi:hypothetical protein STEG23_026816 [Scotinomys teguina]
MILMHLLIESLFFSLTGLLKLCLVIGCGSLHLLPAVFGEKFCDDSKGIHLSDLFGKPVQFRPKQIAFIWLDIAFLTDYMFAYVVNKCTVRMYLDHLPILFICRELRECRALKIAPVSFFRLPDGWRSLIITTPYKEYAELACLLPCYQESKKECELLMQMMSGPGAVQAAA